MVQVSERSTHPLSVIIAPLFVRVALMVALFPAPTSFCHLQAIKGWVVQPGNDAMQWYFNLLQIHTRIHICAHIIHTLPRHHQRWNLTMDESTVLMRRYLVLVFLAMFAMVTLIVLMTRVGRDAAERDPSLDWRTNPNVRTGD